MSIFQSACLYRSIFFTCLFKLAFVVDANEGCQCPGLGFPVSKSCLGRRVGLSLSYGWEIFCFFQRKSWVFFHTFKTNIIEAKSGRRRIIQINFHCLDCLRSMFIVWKFVQNKFVLIA